MRAYTLGHDLRKIRGKRKVAYKGWRPLAWIFLIPTRLPTSAVRFVEERSRYVSLTPLPDPPITDTPQENLGCTPPANLLTRRGWIRIDTSGNPVDLSEELLNEEWCELLRGVLNVLDDLDERFRGFRANCTRRTYLLVDLLRCYTMLS